MKDLFSVFFRFIPPYKWRLARSIVYNILHALFGTLSLVMLTPLLGILFGTEQEVTEKVPFALDIDSIKQVLQIALHTFS